ncbi:MAG: exosortase/archaeosortase family protein [Bryobacteraceae bacterium]
MKISSSPARVGWSALIWFGALWAASYAFVLRRLFEQWLTNEDMSHGLFVPVLVAYIVWNRWDELAALTAQPSLWGIVCIAIAGILLCAGPPEAPTFSIVTRFSMMLSLVGIIWALRGASTLVALRYPLALCLLMIPVPGYVYERITFPLQLIASQLAEIILEWLGYSVLRDGNVLHLPGQSLSVVEACSGLRSLLSLTFLGQAYIYLFDRRPWMRLATAVAVIPIALFANSIRIVFSAWLGRQNPDWMHGIFHDSTAWVVFVVAFAGLVLFHKTFNRLVPMHRVEAVNA